MPRVLPSGLIQKPVYILPEWDAYFKEHPEINFSSYVKSVIGPDMRKKGWIK